MSTSSPLISIAMPVHNVEATVSAAIHSVLAQTFIDWELLIVNDGSSDETLDIIQRFRDPRIRIWSDNERLGISARLNETIEQSRGKYYARMDGDDVAYPQRLERQLAFVKSDPDLDLVGAWMLVFGKNGVPLGKRTASFEPNRNNVLKTIPLAHPTFFGKSDWFRKNHYAAFPRHFQDQEMLQRTIKQSQFEVVPEILLGYREEALSIRKQVKYRWSYVQAFPDLARTRSIRYALTMAGIQFAKLGVDIFAIGTGLNYRVLHNRARAITPAERQRWQAIWALVNQATCE